MSLIKEAFGNFGSFEKCLSQFTARHQELEHGSQLTGGHGSVSEFWSEYFLFILQLLLRSLCIFYELGLENKLL